MPTQLSRPPSCGAVRWGVGEIDNLPIGPGGAAWDDETRPEQLLPGDRRNYHPSGGGGGGGIGGLGGLIIQAPQRGRFGVNSARVKA